MNEPRSYHWLKLKRFHHYITSSIKLQKLSRDAAKTLVRSIPIPRTTKQIHWYFTFWVRLWGKRNVVDPRLILGSLKGVHCGSSLDIIVIGVFEWSNKDKEHLVWITSMGLFGLWPMNRDNNATAYLILWMRAAMFLSDSVWVTACTADGPQHSHELI